MKVKSPTSSCSFFNFSSASIEFCCNCCSSCSISLVISFSEVDLLGSYKEKEFGLVNQILTKGIFHKGNKFRLCPIHKPVCDMTEVYISYLEVLDHFKLYFAVEIFFFSMNSETKKLQLYFVIIWYLLDRHKVALRFKVGLMWGARARTPGLGTQTSQAPATTRQRRY